MVFTPEQVNLFLDAATGDRLYALYVVAVHTGLRFGELAALRWESVNLEEGKVTISRTLSGKTFATPKTAKSRRTVKLTRTAIEALRSHLTRQLEEIEGTGTRWQENGLVFATTVGTPLNRHNVTQRSFNRILTKAGLPNSFTFHSLRHTYATLALAKNVNPKIVSEALGHSTIAITLDTYSHLLPTMQETIATAIEDVLS